MSDPRAAIPALLALALAACAPVQRVSFHCVPKTVTVYVDGERLAVVPEEIELRSDEHHTLVFAGGGYQRTDEVLVSRETEGGPELWPRDLCDELRFVEVRKDLEVELE